MVDLSITAAGNDHIIGRGGSDLLLGDNGDFDATTSVGTAGGNDELDGGNGSADDCDGEAGTDEAQRCEILAGTP